MEPIIAGSWRQEETLSKQIDEYRYVNYAHSTSRRPIRLQLALDVSDIDEAIDFYSKLFGVEPVKRKPGYANFAIENPPLKLVLFENPDNAGGFNHLGV